MPLLVPVVMNMGVTGRNSTGGERSYGEAPFLHYDDTLACCSGSASESGSSELAGTRGKPEIVNKDAFSGPLGRASP